MRKAPRLRVGTKIGELLTVLDVINTGGYNSTVYLVWHHQAWCPMVCKFYGSEADRASEAGILTHLAHPNIVRFLGSGGPPPHVLLEYLDGPTLRTLTRNRRPLSISDTLRVGVHIGAALAYMHRRDILHLDVKPSNIIVVHGRPVLFDLGSARHRNDWGRIHHEGTPPYMAPEQCLEGQVSPATDVFALAVTLFEVLAGKLPFRLGSPRRPYPQTQDEPVPLHRYRRGIHSKLDYLLQRCLSRTPQERPPLSEVILTLHDLIGSGPAMWPVGFRPEIPCSEIVHATRSIGLADRCARAEPGRSLGAVRRRQTVSHQH